MRARVVRFGAALLLIQVAGFVLMQLRLSQQMSDLTAIMHAQQARYTAETQRFLMTHRAVYLPHRGVFMVDLDHLGSDKTAPALLDSLKHPHASIE